MSSITRFLNRLVRSPRHNSQFYEIKTRLEKDIRHFTYLNEWKDAQKLACHLKWLSNLEFAIRDTHLALGKNSKATDLSRVPTELLQLPLRWTSSNPLLKTYCSGLYNDLLENLSNNDFQECMYKPEKILSYPKILLVKAMSFLVDQYRLDNASIPPDERRKILHAIMRVKSILVEFFVDDTSRSLPNETMSNGRIGRQLKEAQLLSYEDELKLIEWRTYIEWLKLAGQFIEKNDIGLALICIDQSVFERTLDQIEYNSFVGILHLSIAEHYMEIDDDILAQKHLKIAAPNNSEASEILHEKY